MSKVTEYFGCMLFDDHAMQSRLPLEAYEALKQTVQQGKQLEAWVADAVAAAMRDWAVEKGATHYSHWFQPMSGITAEKHDSFISPVSGGGIIMEFSGKELVCGEPDASSFPSGGLRATFEARGYTAWDPTSPAFIKENTLCIPTAFCAYGGEVLDKKTPLLRSMEAINRQSLRILRLFGNETVSSVTPSVGTEQEYFLIDRDVCRKREDITFTGRTLFGARPPKSQEMDDHYFGSIKPRVKAFMEDLNEELWKLGVPAKTEHNETAPAQHELACVYTTNNIATDHNQLTMEIMQKVAERHNLVCLLHEKPFSGVNGSGKHNNWSLSTDTGVNLLSPGETPHENAQFLLIIAAVIKAVDEYQDLIRASIATAGNDHRLGGNEAPPAVVSVFLGEELTGILEAIENGEKYSAAEKTVMKLGVHSLPRFTRDTTDRNRTSPIAFTGNKFEIRMLGASNSIACCNIMFNSAVAHVFGEFADELEGKEDLSSALNELIGRTFAEHKRVVFNGNGYDEAWVKEAVNVRGLSNLPTTPDCLPALIADKNVEMLSAESVFSGKELHARYEILLDNYCKTVLIEANTMTDMVRRQILPAVEKYTGDLARNVSYKKELVSTEKETEFIKKLSKTADEIYDAVEKLEKHCSEVHAPAYTQKQADTIRDVIIPDMEKLRVYCDEAEKYTAASYWPFPVYSELLFSV